MTRVPATLPGFASVARAAEVLHLARRSVRDLIYAGRLPSTRVGRLHFIKSADLETERRRRLGLPLTHRAPTGRPRKAAEQPPTAIRHRQLSDPALRRQRADERAVLVRNWAERHHPVGPHVPAVVLGVTAPVTCEACGRVVRSGRIVEIATDAAPARLCTTCGRRALLDWADRRRQEAAAARRLSESLGQPQEARSA